MPTQRESCPAAGLRLLTAVRPLTWVPEARRLRHGDHLFREGAVVETVSVVVGGLVALRRSARGRRATLVLVRPGSVVDDGPLLGTTRVRYDAIAVADSEVLSLPAAPLWQTLHTSPRIAGLWAIVAACGLSVYRQRLVEVLAGDIRARVASLLLQEADGGDATALTHQMMADLLGVQRSSVGRVLAEFEQRGIVHRGYAHLRVHDRPALELAARGYAAATPIPLDDAG